MAKNLKLKKAAGYLLGLVVIATVFLFIPNQEKEYAKTPVLKDQSHHPVYSTYRFSPPKGVVRIGIQPFWVYVANIMEAMRRDRILAQDLAELGLRAEYHSFLNGQDINFFMKKGHIDMGLSGYIPTLQLASEQDILIPASLDRSFYDLVARDVYSIQQLEGKRIGTSFGTDPHHAISDALESTHTKATLIQMEGNTMVEAMQNDTIDAAMTWEPITSALLKQNNNLSVVFRSRWVSFMYFDRGFASANPRGVKAFLSALIRAINWLNADRDNFIISSNWAIEACLALSPDFKISRKDFVSQAQEAREMAGKPIIYPSELADGGLLYSGFQFLKNDQKIPAGIEWRDVLARFDKNLVAEIIINPLKWRLNEFDYEGTGGGHE